MRMAIIGAGVLGCAIARELLQKNPKLDLTVFDRLSEPGQLTSRTNSGVVHSGIHLDPQSQKSILAREGRRLIHHYCEEKEIPLHKCGMLIVATHRDLRKIFSQFKEFFKILDQAHKSGVQIKIRLPLNLIELEPDIRSIGGIEIEKVAIIDQEAFVFSLFREATKLGAIFRFNHSVEEISKTRKSWTVRFGEESMHFDFIINSAGPGAERIAARMGRFHQVFYVRGEYAIIKNNSLESIEHLIYPIPQKGSGGLGVHLTPTTKGEILIGPNTVPIKNPEDSGSVVPRNSIESFKEAVEPFYSNIKNTELALHFSGVRCKSANGDFVFDCGSNYIHIIGYESPGLTASLATAKHITKLINY